MLITAAGSPAQLIPRQTNTDTALPEPESGNPAEGDDDDVEDAPVDTAAPPPDAEETDVAIGDESGPSDVTSPTRRQEEEGTTTPPATGTPTATQQQATTGLGTTGRDDDDTTAPTDPTTNPNDDNTTAGPTHIEFTCRRPNATTLACSRRRHPRERICFHAYCCVFIDVHGDEGALCQWRALSSLDSEEPELPPSLGALPLTSSFPIVLVSVLGN